MRLDAGRDDDDHHDAGSPRARIGHGALRRGNRERPADWNHRGRGRPGRRPVPDQALSLQQGVHLLLHHMDGPPRRPLRRARRRQLRQGVGVERRAGNGQGEQRRHRQRLRRPPTGTGGRHQQHASDHDGRLAAPVRDRQ